jgi:hypothetical protein
MYDQGIGSTQVHRNFLRKKVKQSHRISKKFQMFKPASKGG